MKNANSRFVRVLALVLVVLMVVPAALVGCGSKKANDAAISEALAAAQAAKEAAEQAKKDAEAAIKEAEEKAQAALDAAKEAQDKLDALTTTGPVTDPVLGDKKEVSDYAYKVLNDTELDFRKTYDAYKEKANAYTDEDEAAMDELFEATKLAITRADTIDYINQLVANFIAEIEAIPTYVERVVAAYEAIDFDSDYDVIDVVYAYNLLVKAEPAADKVGAMSDEDYNSLAKYGEDEIDVKGAIATEYYRYTGKGAAAADVEVLYADMFDAAADVAAEVIKLFNGAELDASKLPYVAGIDKNVAAVRKAYSAWYNSYFAKDEALAAHFEAFRQAFVGKDYLLTEEGDFLWDLVEASKERAAALVAAAQEYKDTLKSLVNKIAGFTTIKYWSQAAQVAEAAAALDAWKLKYDFKTVDGVEDANVALIIGADAYKKYADKATAINYFVYLENTASAVNVEGFVKAYDEDLHDNNTIVFDFAKYASSVSSVLDWYYGKKDKDGKRTGGFDSIVAADVKGFGDLGDEFNVANLPTGEYAANLEKIYKELFGFPITEANFEAMEDAYDALAAKKEIANNINKKIAKLLEDGISAKNYTEFAAIAGDEYLKYVDEEDEAVKATYLKGEIKTNFVGGVIAIGDKNFDAMINWDNLDAIWDAYTGTLTDVIEQAKKIALEYIAWAGDPATDGGIDYQGAIFGELEPLVITAFSYDVIAEIVALKDKLDIVSVMNDDAEITVTVEADEEEVEFSLEEVITMCGLMRDYFYNDIFATMEAYTWGTTTTTIGRFATSTQQYTDWMTQIEDLEGSTAGNKDETKDYYSDNFATLYSTKEFYANWSEDALKVISENCGWSSVVEFGDAIGTTKKKSYQGAVLSVDPTAYVKKNSDGTYSSFDSAAYKAAIASKTNSVYTEWLGEFIVDVKSTPAKFDLVVKNIADLALNYGMWNIAGEIEIDGEDYTFTYGTVDGKSAAFALIDSYGEAVTAPIVVKYNGGDYNVTVAPVYEDGKFIITPTVTPVGDAKEIDEDLYSDDFAFLGLDKEELTFDVRDEAQAIADAFASFASVKKPGTTKGYTPATIKQLTDIFAAEARNDFYVAYMPLKAAMFNAKSNGEWNSFGNYITNFASITDVYAKAVIELASKDALDKAIAMTPDNSTIEQAKAVFEVFKREVKAALTAAGIDYTVNAGDIETVTIQ